MIRRFRLKKAESIGADPQNSPALSETLRLRAESTKNRLELFVDSRFPISGPFSRAEEGSQGGSIRKTDLCLAFVLGHP